MKIVLPTDTNHDIDFIPRFYPTGAIDLYLTNESTKVEVLVASTYIIQNGFVFLNFDKTFSDGQKYRIKITENSNVVFRGKLLVTTQDTQEYKLTKGKYYYE
tara:strand:+ start:1382 stop:1687 length:306 start_codon:yes stop_codon:yes gene_type:complete